jgi:hypothetical protein
MSTSIEKFEHPVHFINFLWEDFEGFLLSKISLVLGLSDL